MKTSAILLIVAAIIGSVILALAAIFIGGYNRLNSLHITYEMKVKANSSEFDNMWKKIKQAAAVPDSKKAALVEVLNAYTGGRQAGQNQAMTWVKEAVPATNGLDIYDKLMNIITGSRDTWTTKQTELVAVAEEYNKEATNFPGNIIAGVFAFKPIDPKVITSTRTEEVFVTGKDDDV